MNIYSIKNEKLGFFNRPIYCENNAEALSYIQNVLMSDADRALLGLKDDLALYFLGTFNSDSGIIGGIIEPQLVCSLREIFDTIPEDKIPRSERQINESMKYLDGEIKKLQGILDTLKVDKKGRITHD